MYSGGGYISELIPGKHFFTLDNIKLLSLGLNYCPLGNKTNFMMNSSISSKLFFQEVQ